MTIEDKIRITWKSLEYNKPIRIIITDWNGLERYFFNKYLLVDIILEYKARPAQLCVPYNLFVNKIRKLPVKLQKLIVEGRAVIELEKLFKSEERGMRLGNVEEYKGR